MSITAAFVEGVAGELTRFAGRLAGADASIRAALDATSTGLDGLDTAMSGPRPTGLQAIVRAYVAESREVPAAISAAHDTVARWSATAAVYASELSAAESRVARLRFEAAQAGAPAETLDRLSVAIADVEELGESWLRLCRSFSAELTSAIAMIERANATMLGGGPSGFRTSTGEVTVQSIVATLIGLQPADRSAAVSDMRATWVGSPAALELVLAMAEEVERRRDEPWNAVLAEHGIPLPVDGEAHPQWVSIEDDVYGTYGRRKDEGGWHLVNMIHDGVADAIAAEASLIHMPVAVEGLSLGGRTTDIVVPPSA